ncbi:MAG: hypothetical protein JRH05_05385 [Deltaproteobacteria bacterium]|nr:hypothetical protein [Deltaproteobacteria bacterium]MBW2102098.1 hypothetical protein [Deltaproteobacteria bacterium]
MGPVRPRDHQEGIELQRHNGMVERLKTRHYVFSFRVSRYGIQPTWVDFRDAFFHQQGR